MLLYLYIFFSFFSERKRKRNNWFQQTESSMWLLKFQPNSQIPRLEMSGNIKLLMVGHNLAALNAPGSRTERVLMVVQRALYPQGPRNTVRTWACLPREYVSDCARHVVLRQGKISTSIPPGTIGIRLGSFFYCCAVFEQRKALQLVGSRFGPPGVFLDPDPTL